MRIHILGICGTFMGGVAMLAREAGFEVTGQDQNVYPPMSDQLAAQGIALHEGYDPERLEPVPDCVIVGNALSRGNPAVEAVLDRGLHYTSGPQWLAEHVLKDRVVLAVAGTHGKTTTASMLVWILEHTGLEPGFLIGGVPMNFGVSARLGRGDPFVVEADEYDTAFFDKRSKFVHYRPQIAVLNNLEYDHADIFPDLDAIKRQFHHLVRTIPGRGLLVVNADDEALADVLSQGCWSRVEGFSLDRAGGAQWSVRHSERDKSEFSVLHADRVVGTVRWNLAGTHNRANALAAIAAATGFGVEPGQAVTALSEFRGVKRRLEKYGPVGGITVYDDFAHHPTEIRATLTALRESGDEGRLLVALEPRSNSMRAGVHADRLAPALALADHVWIWSDPEWDWRPERVAESLSGRGETVSDVDELVEMLGKATRPGDRVVFMSNGSFGGARARLLEKLQRQRVKA